MVARGLWLLEGGQASEQLVSVQFGGERTYCARGEGWRPIGGHMLKLVSWPGERWAGLLEKEAMQSRLLLV